MSQIETNKFMYFKALNDEVFYKILYDRFINNIYGLNLAENLYLFIIVSSFYLLPTNCCNNKILAHYQNIKPYNLKNFTKFPKKFKRKHEN